MQSYVIGDIQGCFDEFIALLSLIEFKPNLDKVYLVGDLVNRGPQSLDVLRFVYENRMSTHLVLGNHDLHLLACWVGVATAKPQDTIADILEAADVDILLNWLRMQPLMVELPNHIIVHAGINPDLSLMQNRQLAKYCSEKLAGDNFAWWLSNMYGNTPLSWSDDLSEVERFRFGINSFTRMRMLAGSGLDLRFKGTIESAPAHLRPWFVENIEGSKVVIFGHWSALGLFFNEKVIALDTGCIWGGQLTAICLENSRLFQCPAQSGVGVVGE